MQNRRDWLKSALTVSAALPLGALAQTLMAAPMSKAEIRFSKSHGQRAIQIKLNANENPYGPSEGARKAIATSLTQGNRYPSVALSEFRKLLADHEGVTPDHILVGAGSSDLLCASGAAFGVEGGSILSAFPTFPMLPNYAVVYNAEWEKVNVNEKLETDYAAFARRITGKTRMIYICNPNNPTGTLVDPAVVRSFCEDVSSKTPVFSDEAYLEFMEPSKQVSMVDLVKAGKNVIVSRTFSKIYGLAGLRIGYIIATPDMAKKISRHHPGIPCNQAGIAAATASLGDEGFTKMVRQKNAEARKHLTDYLEHRKLFYGKSETNFVMFDPREDGYRVMSRLAEKGIAIRVWDYQARSWCRVSIGTLDEMKLFTAAMESL